MSEKYIPLYRKYRPQKFADLVGQENIKTALGNAIKLGKISHAYLFCGPRGTGKTSTARIFAKSLNCVEGPTLTPCEKCPSCVDITNTTPVDVIELDAASNRSVEDTQKILEKIQYVPTYGKYKIYIIDEVHMLSSQAFNSLLKTLEEPPENVIFILATTEAHKVLDTIVSRCQSFDFRRITVDDIVARLKYICGEEKINITDDALLTIAKSSLGGMRDALSLLDQISILGVEKEITTDDVNELLGKISYDILNNIVSKLADKDIQGSLEIIDGIYDKGNEPLQILNNIIEYLRNVLIIKNCSDIQIAVKLTQLSETVIKKVSEQAKGLKIEDIIYWINKFNKYVSEMKTSTNRYLTLELCLIDVISVCGDDVSDLIQRVENLESRMSSGSFEIKKSVNLSPTQKVKQPEENFVSKPAPIVENIDIPTIENKKNEETEKPTILHQTAKADVKPVADTSKVEKSGSWSDILNLIESTTARSLFQSLGKPQKVTSEEVIVAFSKDMFVEQAKDEQKFNALKKALLQYFNVENINITITKKTYTPNAEPPKAVVAEPPKKPDNIPDNSEIEAFEDNKKDDTPQSEKSAEVPYSEQVEMVKDLFNGKII